MFDACFSWAVKGYYKTLRTSNLCLIGLVWCCFWWHFLVSWHLSSMFLTATGFPPSQNLPISRLTSPTCVRTLSEVGVDVFALVDLADFIFGPKNSLSFASFMDVSWLGCESLGERFGAIWVIYFPTNWGAKEPQNLPNHRVVGQHLGRNKKGDLRCLCVWPFGVTPRLVWKCRKTVMFQELQRPRMRV